jgi:hypothetical protein
MAERKLRWDDQDLAVRSDGGFRAAYRRLQSWYRETQLHAVTSATTAVAQSEAFSRKRM